MVSLRRRRLLGLSSGSSSSVTTLPLICEKGTAYEQSTQHKRKYTHDQEDVIGEPAAKWAEIEEQESQEFFTSSPRMDILATTLEKPDNIGQVVGVTQTQINEIASQISDRVNASLKA